MENGSLLTIMQQAMDNAREGITISDATKNDNPLIYVNKGFTAMTGYSHEEAIGKNCRFLQGVTKGQEGARLLKEAIAQQKAVQVELVNYHKNGSLFHNKLSVTPVFDAAGKLTNFIGVQEDVTELKNKAHIEQQMLLHQLTTEVTIQVQEKERMELGKELHDNITQLLATAKLLMGTIKMRPEMSGELLQKSTELVDKSIDELRQLSKSLVGPALHQQSLKASVSNLVDDIQLAAPFRIHLLQEQLEETALSQPKKLMLYRIIQEGLNNTIKYAKAKNVTIAFNQNGKNLDLLIKDDGIGFDPSKAASGIGLKNISNRLQIEKGRMELDTAPGKGCQMKVSIPV